MHNTTKPMRRLLSTLSALTLMVVALMATSCSSKHAKILPADCCAVMKIDTKSLLSKSNIEDSPELKDWKEKLLEAAERDFSSATCKRLKELLDDPTGFGVDLRKPVYLYAPSKSFPYMGFVAKVLNDDDINEVMEMIKKETDDGRIREYDKCRMYVSDNERAAFAYDGDILIFATPVDGSARLTRDLSKRFEEMDDNSIFDNEAFVEMNDRDDDVAACLMMDNLIKAMPGDAAEEMREACKGYDVEDYSLIAGLKLGDETVDFYTEVLCASDEAKKFMEDNADIFKEVTDKYLASIPDDAFLVGGLGADGARWLKLLEKSDMVRSELERMGDGADWLRNCLKAAEGDAVMAMAGYPENGGDVPDFFVFADCKNRSSVDQLVDTFVRESGEYAGESAAEVDSAVGYVPDSTAVYDYDEYDGYGGYDSYYDSYYRHEPAITRDSDTGFYRYNLNPYRTENIRYAWFGTTGNAFFVSTRENVRPDRKASSSVADAPYAERIKGKRVFFVVDFNRLFAIGDLRRQLDRTPLKNYIDYLDTFEAYAESPFKVTAQLRFKDLGKNETPVSLLFDLLVDCADA